MSEFTILGEFWSNVPGLCILRCRRFIVQMNMKKLNDIHVSNQICIQLY